MGYIRVHCSSFNEIIENTFVNLKYIIITILYFMNSFYPSGMTNVHTIHISYFSRNIGTYIVLCINN